MPLFLALVGSVSSFSNGVNELKLNEPKMNIMSTFPGPLKVEPFDDSSGGFSLGNQYIGICTVEGQELARVVCVMDDPASALKLAQLMAAAPELHETLSQLVEFSNVGALHPDRVDAMQQAVKLLRRLG